MLEHRRSILAVAASAAFALLAACGPPPGGEGVIGQPGRDAGAIKVGAGGVCARHDDCVGGHCKKLFVCEKDRAVSCNRDMNDCAANGVVGSACVEECTGTCSGE